MAAAGRLVLGFTGTQAGMTDAQQEALARLLHPLRNYRFVIGLCTGADEQAAQIARRSGARMLIGFPGSPPGHPKRSTFKCDVEFALRPELERNRLIARTAALVIAAPRQEREFILRRSRERSVPPERVVIRSGTWATVRYALSLPRPVNYIWPDGQIDETAPYAGRSFCP